MEVAAVKLPPNDSMIWPVLIIAMVNAAFVIGILTNYDNDPDLLKDGKTLLEINVGMIGVLGFWFKARGDK